MIHRIEYYSCSIEKCNEAGYLSLDCRNEKEINNKPIAENI